MNKITLIYWNNNTSARGPISCVFVLTRMLLNYFLDAFKLLRDFKAGQKMLQDTVSSIEISNFIDHVYFTEGYT